MGIRKQQIILIEKVLTRNGFYSKRESKSLRNVFFFKFGLEWPNRFRIA